jgi:hypothetical protein
MEVSMDQKRAAVFSALVLFVVTSAGWAQDIPIRAADVPREFKGEFAWRDETKPYTLTLEIDKIDEKHGTIRFSGSHLFTPGDYKMKVDGTIDAKSRRITIRESDPSRADSDTDGSFEGTITADLQTIEAVWTTKSTGNKGTLKVQAKKAK